MALPADRDSARAARPSAALAAGRLVEGLRAAAIAGWHRLGFVADDYEFDTSRWSAGPRRATMLIALRVRVECSFILPVILACTESEVRIDTSRGWGCWLHCRDSGGNEEDDLMRLAFEGRDALLRRLVLGGLLGRHRFRTLRGLRDLRQRYGARDFRYVVTTRGVRVAFVAEMEAS